MITNQSIDPGDLTGDEEGPFDPDIVLATEWLVGEITPERRREFEDRFIEDEPFAEKVMPLIEIWTAPIDFRAAYEDYARKVAVEAVEPPPPPVPPPVEVRLPVPDEAPSVTRITDLPAPGFYAQRLAPATRPQRWTTVKRRFDIVYKIAVVLAIVGGPITFGVIKYTGAHSTYVASGDTRMPVGDMWHSQQVETQGGETRTATMRNGSQIVLRPGTRSSITYPLPGWGARVLLDGEAVFEVSAGERFVEVRTAAGRALLVPGTYAIRGDSTSGVMLVTVTAGVAGVRGDSGGTSLQVNKGEHARVRRGELPAKVDNSAADGYPSTGIMPSQRPPAGAARGAAGPRSQKSPR